MVVHTFHFMYIFRPKSWCLFGQTRQWPFLPTLLHNLCLLAPIFTQILQTRNAILICPVPGVSKSSERTRSSNRSKTNPLTLPLNYIRPVRLSIKLSALTLTIQKSLSLRQAQETIVTQNLP